ncbi:replication protein P [Pantoea sp. Lij88]|uniref:replication protein P n=1 Tax=Pantoea sp. Lij88 TaxID=3028622 RepID=UPI0024BB7C0D|nr:replication protein P [Pantoea sp. Lij88]WHQ73462.1 replication protein P [Pantoea sp. Lij88]
MTKPEPDFDEELRNGHFGPSGADQQQCSRLIDSNAERLVDTLFASLKVIFPASFSTVLKHPRDEATAKRQWVAAFIENGITSGHQLSAGMKRARASVSPFWPTPGQFISWCRKGDYVAAGLPDENMLCDMVMRYCAQRGLYHSPEAYPWQDNTHYWMVTSLYSQMTSHNLSESELRKACEKELEKMSRRIREGESIPPPRAQLEKIYEPVSPERARAHISRLKMLLKRNSKHDMKPFRATELTSVLKDASGIDTLH